MQSAQSSFQGQGPVLTSVKSIHSRDNFKSCQKYVLRRCDFEFQDRLGEDHLPANAAVQGEFHQPLAFTGVRIADRLHVEVVHHQIRPAPIANRNREGAARDIRHAAV